MNHANIAFVLYLEHSYRYYEMDHALISDATYDALCRSLLEEWQHVDHRHKHLTDEHALAAGTGFHIKYPGIIAYPCQRNPTRTLFEVYNTMAFADEHERKAHDIICTIKYGGCGGTVSNQLLKQVGDILRGGPIRKLPLPLPKPAMPLPKPRMPQ